MTTPTPTLRDQIAAVLKANIPVNDDTKLDRVRYPDLAKARKAYVARERNQRVANLRAKAVLDAYASRINGDPAIKPVVGVGPNQVTIGHVEQIDGGIEVWLGEKDGPPAFRIFNPPSLIADPAGDIDVNGRKHREAPLEALANVIVRHQTGKRSAMP